MRRASIMMHTTAVLLSIAALTFLWYVFIQYGSGSYWLGTLRARAFGYYFDGPSLAVATVTGAFLIALSVGRLAQLLAPGFLWIGRWAGLRAAANTYLAVLFMVLFFVLPDIDLVADPLRGALQRIFPVLGSFGEDAAQQNLPPDSELDFPKLPYAPEKDPLGTAAFTDLSGASVTLGELRGKTIFLNVWATWCGPCRKEMPNIEALYESMKDEPDVLFILAACDQKAVVEKFLKDNPHKAPIYLLNDESKKKLKVTAFPTTMILSKEGDIVFKQLGYAAWDGGTTKAFLLALAHGEAFTPPNSLPKEIKAATGLVYDETKISEDTGVMSLAYGSEGAAYFADYFSGTVGKIDLQAGTLVPILSELNGPNTVVLAGEYLYFLESGTEGARFKDGALNRLHILTGTRDVMCHQLEYPASMFVDAVGSIYVLEAAGSSTSFGGRNRLVVFKQGSATYEVVLDALEQPEAVLVDKQGGIYIGTMGSRSPGDDAKLLKYSRGSASPEEIAKGLPSVHDMAFDSAGNIYLAGFGMDDGAKVGIGMVAAGTAEFKAIKTDCQASCLTVNSAGDILFSTGRGNNSIGLLRRK